MGKMENPVAVSVVCTSFNHAKYIRKTLDGFLMQKTDFRFEVIVHDDASTDGTQEILKEYQQKYPDVFRLILQEENIYSRGISCWDYLFPLVQGEYIAECEGDDYWTDTQKLQLQVDYMEKHPECSLVAHNGVRVNDDGEYLSVYSPDSHTEEYDLDFAAMIPNLSLFPTASMLYRKSFVRETETFLRTVPSYDYVYKLVLAGTGCVHMIPRAMSAYRMASDGSWTVRIAQNPERYAKHLESSIGVLEKIDTYFTMKYHKEIEEEIRKRAYDAAEARNNLPVLKSQNFREIYRRKGLRYKVRMNFSYYMPGFYRWLKSRR